jgi:hypothetical protein
MSSLFEQLPARISDPLIVSAIFAPKAHNQTLLSVMLPDEPAQGHGLEFLFEGDQRVPRQGAFAGPGWARLEQIISEYLRTYFTVVAQGTAVTISTGVAPRQSVPLRTFPFASHLNLLGGTDEGVFIELDDDINR